MDSDVDLVVLTTNTEIHDEGWIAEAAPPGAELVNTADWGALVERRVVLTSALRSACACTSSTGAKR